MAALTALATLPCPPACAVQLQARGTDAVLRAESHGDSRLAEIQQRWPHALSCAVSAITIPCLGLWLLQRRSAVQKERTFWGENAELHQLALR